MDIKFIHCADLHIDSPFKGISDINPELKELLYQSTFESFNNIVNLAIQKEVLCVIISGDIYDGADKSLSAQLKFRNGLQQLSENGIQCYIVYGNHDPLDSWAASIEWPENVFQFGGDEVEYHPLTVDGEVVAHIYGISFPTRDVRENLALEFERVDENIPAIAVLHTNVGENTGHEPYAPATIDELKSRNMDYWALGHLHKFQIFNECNPAIVYPGNSQARNPREVEPKGCCLVTLYSGGDCDIEFIPTDVVRYQSVKLDISDCSNWNELMHSIKVKCEEISEKMDGRHTIIRLSLSGRTNLHKELQKGDNVGDLLEEIRENFEDREPWIWVEKINMKTAGSYDLDVFRRGSDFIADIISLYDELEDNNGDIWEEIHEALKPLFETWQGQKYLKELTREELLELIREARNWTLDQMIEIE